ncbi:zinc finger protein 45 [Caerostris extrusa]|uniref:Zinc finger protein 45 n=1 Tax=Caerostris extrusa TaxID=172846 RepID=A0AAV4YAU0_CAEEX|nr:zinc finger protein 45 [Caerostris extrusa]
MPANQSGHFIFTTLLREDSDRSLLYLLLNKKGIHIRHRFGCYDEIQKIDCRRVRHCNWIRFLKSSPTLSNEVNLFWELWLKVNQYSEAVRTVPSNTELVVYLENTGDADDSLRSQMSLMACRSLTAAQLQARDGLNIREGKSSIYAVHGDSIDIASKSDEHSNMADLPKRNVILGACIAIHAKEILARAVKSSDLRLTSDEEKRSLPLQRRV